MYYAHSSKNGIPAQSYQSHVNGMLRRVREYTNIMCQYAKYDGELLAQTAEVAAYFTIWGSWTKRIKQSCPEKNHLDPCPITMLTQEWHTCWIKGTFPILPL